MQEIPTKTRFNVQFETESKDEDGDIIGFTSKIVADSLDDVYVWAKAQIGSEFEGHKVAGIRSIDRHGHVGII